MKRFWAQVGLLMAGTFVMNQQSMEAGPEAAVGAQAQAQAQAHAKTEGGADAVRPFRVRFPDEVLTDMKSRSS